MQKYEKKSKKQQETEKMCQNRSNFGAFSFFPDTMGSKKPKRLLPKVSESFTESLRDYYRKSPSLLPKVSETFGKSLQGL